MISLFSNTIQIYTFKGGEMVTKIPPKKMTGERKGTVGGGDYDNPQFNYNSVQLKVIIRDNVWFWEISNLQFNITVYTKQAVNSLLFIVDSSFF